MVIENIALEEMRSQTGLNLTEKTGSPILSSV